MKYVIRLLLLFLSLAYLVFVTVRYSRAEDTRACTALQIDILDSAQATFISKGGIEKMLQKNRLHPVGQTINSISPIKIEHAIMVEKKEGVEPGMVIEVLQKGYKLKDRVLRAAMVKVSE